MTSDLASTIVSNVLLYSIYGACVLVGGVMPLMILHMERGLYVSPRRRRELDAQVRLNANWPQTIIQEQP